MTKHLILTVLHLYIASLLTNLLFFEFFCHGPKSSLFFFLSLILTRYARFLVKIARELNCSLLDPLSSRCENWKKFQTLCPTDFCHYWKQNIVDPR